MVHWTKKIYTLTAKSGERYSGMYRCGQRVTGGSNIHRNLIYTEHASSHFDKFQTMLFIFPPKDFYQKPNDHNNTYNDRAMNKASVHSKKEIIIIIKYCNSPPLKEI